MIEYSCPSCREQLESPNEHAGILVDCPFCAKPVRVPGRVAAAIVEPLEEAVAAGPPLAAAVPDAPNDPFANIDVEDEAPSRQRERTRDSARRRSDDDDDESERDRRHRGGRDSRSSREIRREPKKASSATLLFLGVGIGVLLIGGGILIWQAVKDPKPAEGDKKEVVEAPPPEQKPAVALNSEEIFKRAVSSVALVEVLNEKENKYVGGSAAIIDKNRKLVLTAYHVVENAQTIDVIFPKHVGGKLVTDAREYGRPDRIFAKIWKTDPSKDLAILQVDWVPPESRALPLAAASPEPGEETHTIGGSPEASIGLWIYSKGNVREVQRDTFVLDNNQMIDAWIVRATNPINRGDSGGALINKTCELAGVCCAMNRRAEGIRAFIDVREVKTLLGRK